MMWYITKCGVIIKLNHCHMWQVAVNGLVCAGKKIHEVLLDAGNAGIENVADNYVQKCQLISDLCHPNITLKAT